MGIWGSGLTVFFASSSVVWVFEGAGGARIRVGEIPDLAAAIDLWLAQGDAIDVGLVDQDPPEGRPSNLDI
jgi:hypothetical protein